MEPLSIEYQIGDNVYGQRIRLVRSRTTDGKIQWVLHQDEADQRDKSSTIAGLTKENIVKLAEAVSQHVR